MKRKAFTVAEANALLPALTDTFREIESFRRRMRDTAKKIEVLELLWGGGVRDLSNPDHGEFEGHREELDRAMRGIEQAVNHGIVGRGLRFPMGGLDQGLVDFPTSYQGRWVYLCWRLGETSVTHWHEIESGFRGRRNITSLQKREMGTDDPSTLDDSALDF